MVIKMNDTLMVVIVGITIVFILLIVLIIFLNVMGMIFNKTNKNDTNIEKKERLPLEIVDEVIPQPIIEEGISEEVVAAISAAIYIVTDGRPLIIKRIKKSINTANTRSAWGLAGSIDNTTSF